MNLSQLFHWNGTGWKITIDEKMKMSKFVKYMDHFDTQDLNLPSKKIETNLEKKLNKKETSR